MFQWWIFFQFFGAVSLILDVFLALRIMIFVLGVGCWVLLLVLLVLLLLIYKTIVISYFLSVDAYAAGAPGAAGAAGAATICLLLLFGFVCLYLPAHLVRSTWCDVWDARISCPLSCSSSVGSGVIL